MAAEAGLGQRVGPGDVGAAERHTVGVVGRGQGPVPERRHANSRVGQKVRCMAELARRYGSW